MSDTITTTTATAANAAEAAKRIAAASSATNANSVLAGVTSDTSNAVGRPAPKPAKQSLRASVKRNAPVKPATSKPAKPAASKPAKSTARTDLAAAPVKLSASKSKTAGPSKTAQKRAMGDALLAAAAEVARTMDIPAGMKRADVVDQVRTWMSYVPHSTFPKSLGKPASAGGRNAA